MISQFEGLCSNGAGARPLHARIRESGIAAVTTANKLPAILAYSGLQEDALHRLAEGIEGRLAESARLAMEAKHSSFGPVAEKVERLWKQSAAVLAQHVRRRREAA